MLKTDTLIEKLNEQHRAIADHNEKSDQKLRGVSARLDDLEQVAAHRRPAGSVSTMSLGEQVIQHNDFQGNAGSMRDRRGKIQLSLKSITSAGGSGGALSAPDHRPEVVTLARQRTPIRALIASGTTTSNMVQYARQTVRDLNADVVSETVEKPESNLAFELVDAPTRTIAHWVRASKQALDDAAMLRSTINGELQFGVQLTEEHQILYGDGDGQNLHGIVPQAMAYSAPFSVEDENRLDQLLLAIAQVQQALLPATGIVLNDLDWYRLLSLKDADGRYLGAGPFGTQMAVAWTLPVVATPSMAAGHFLVGAFADGAQLFDRETVEVLISNEDGDNFRRNMVTILAEERLALAVKRPQAFVYGAFSAMSA